MCCHFAFGVPTAAALAAVAEFSDGKLVEIGAGAGYWAKLLKVGNSALDHALRCQRALSASIIPRARLCARSQIAPNRVSDWVSLPSSSAGSPLRTLSNRTLNVCRLLCSSTGAARGGLCAV